MDADNGDVKVSVNFNILTDGLAKFETEILTKDIKDKLMQLLPLIKYSNFKMCDARFN